MNIGKMLDQLFENAAFCVVSPRKHAVVIQPSRNLGSMWIHSGCMIAKLAYTEPTSQEHHLVTIEM